MSNHKGTYKGVEYEVIDLTRLYQPGFVSGFYFTVGEPEKGEDDDSIEVTTLEGPYATLEAAVQAVTEFVDQADGPIDYEGKCKRKREDGPTPCLCCVDECVG